MYYQLMETKPTSLAEYTGLQEAYSFFNNALFNGELPECLLTLQRKSKAYGYFSPERFAPRGDDQKHNIDELALNPDGFLGRSDKDILGTLAHEMTHVWQAHFGDAPKRGYHDREFASKMKEIGLYPSDTGMEGGKETGRNMTHYILEDGAYAKAYAELEATGFKLNWESVKNPAKEKAKPSKIKHTCPTCQQNTWGKSGLKVICGVCNDGNDELLMKAEESN
jgi:hypothetical protein